MPECFIFHLFINRSQRNFGSSSPTGNVINDALIVITALKQTTAKKRHHFYLRYQYDMLNN